MGIFDWFKRKPNLEIVAVTKGQEEMITVHLDAVEYKNAKNFEYTYAALIRDIAMFTSKKLPPKLEDAADGGKVLTIWYVPSFSNLKHLSNRNNIIQRCEVHKFHLQTSS
jgi:hypothetical protein